MLYVGEKDIALRELLHKHGLIQVTDILEKYEIDSVTDVSDLKKDDFSALETLRLKSFLLMKINRKMKRIAQSESDDSVSNDSGERESDKDCVVIGRKETVIAHEEVGNTNCKRAATGGTQSEASSKKSKSTMTAEQQTLVQKFKPPPCKWTKRAK